MGRNGKNQPKDREAQVRLSRKREARSIARKGRRYHGYKWWDKTEEAKNPSFAIKKRPRGQSEIQLPQVVSHTEDGAPDALIKILTRLREDALYNPKRRVSIDFSQVAEIEPAAAILLLAEIKRCTAYCSDRTYITGTYPNSDTVSRLLCDLGFFEALGVKNPDFEEGDIGRTFVKVTQHRETDALLIDRLLELFRSELELTVEERRTLHRAFLECMDNVREHAYVWETEEPHLYQEWWMAGFVDHKNKDAHFIFYDQGLGVPFTIKRRKHHRVRDRLRHWNDGHWIARALRKRESRHPSLRRGHGLKRLRAFNKSSLRDISLRIVSNRGLYRLDGASEESFKPIGQELRGTLIEWFIKGPEHDMERI